MTDPTRAPTPEEVVRRLLRAALQRPPTPAELHLAWQAWRQIEQERQEAFIGELHVHYQGE